MTILKIAIVCGETTCASEPGKFCQFVGSRRFGTENVCMLFPNSDPRARDDGASMPLKENADGWLARCPACISASS